MQITVTLFCPSLNCTPLCTFFKDDEKFSTVVVFFYFSGFAFVLTKIPIRQYESNLSFQYVTRFHFKICYVDSLRIFLRIIIVIFFPCKNEAYLNYRLWWIFFKDYDTFSKFLLFFWDTLKKKNKQEKKRKEKSVKFEKTSIWQG